MRAAKKRRLEGAASSTEQGLRRKLSEDLLIGGCTLPAAEFDFRADLIDRFADGKLEYVDIATISWKGTKAGAGGVSDLAVDPTQKGRNHAAKVRNALGLNAVPEKILFEFNAPVWDVLMGKRCIRPMLVKLPHEALARDFYNNRAAYLKARSDPGDCVFILQN